VLQTIFDTLTNTYVSAGVLCVNSLEDL